MNSKILSNNISLTMLVTKFQASFKGIISVIKQPRYLLLTLALSVVFVELLFWLNNINLLFYIFLTPNLNILQKIQFVASTYTSIWQSSTSFVAYMFLIISFLQGNMMACLFYIVRRKRIKGIVKTAGSGGLASILAALGLGCAACGTSLITPILAFLFSSTSTALADSVGGYVLILGAIVSIYGLYSIGLKIRSVDAS